ncbi:hypothetical protein DFR50_1155 [Roseiarcus fermentans]|uniref:SpoIIAA-like protein n=1 Tax=Roseiarcus fermentans TaxID=1473586 RepID=A0A366FB82_9HYPH|nr:STAS/SEC14 domain-containing protein [Roseiarcus fermentans]RBP11898.1 hypothetical protein DFR50_1155 [Roseiarcus fermentans]
MLERIQDAPADALALAASGTVMARDVEQAVDAALGAISAPTGLVVVIGDDFDGYMAELERGLANVAAAHRTIVRIALVTGPGQSAEATLGVAQSAVPIRLFAAGDRLAAFDWAESARPGQ